LCVRMDRFKVVLINDADYHFQNVPTSLLPRWNVKRNKIGQHEWEWLMCHVHPTSDQISTLFDTRWLR
jgi:hypothetical protein